MSRRRRGNSSVAASPVLIGAATVLVALVAVFIAYNANSGLPFVPTYHLNAELPSGGKLVKGNEVRVGGFRVGVVKDIKPEVTTVNGERRSVAVAELALDKKIEPLARDTKFRVRPRSALGLKYIEVEPGTEKATWRSGDTVPVTQSSEPLEFEDLFSTFDRKTRPNIQNATDGFGNAFAGRGRSINSSIQALNPFFKALTPVMQNLSDPSTELDQFFLQIGRSSAQVAPVARTQALLFTDMADTFAAITADPRALQDTIEKGAPTMDVSIDSFRVQRPFMADFTDLSARLRPAAQELPRSLPAVNRAFAVGTPVLPRTVELNENLEKAFGEAEDLFQNPNTLLALKDLTTAVTVTRPAHPVHRAVPDRLQLLQLLHPPAGRDAVRGPDRADRRRDAPQPEREDAQLAPAEQLRQLDRRRGRGTSSRTRSRRARRTTRATRCSASTRPPTTRPSTRRATPTASSARPATRTARSARPATSRGDLQDGSEEHGLPIPDEVGKGANGAITENNLPGLSGGTYKSRELGIDNLADVP